VLIVLVFKFDLERVWCMVLQTLREVLLSETALENFAFPADFDESWLDMTVAAYAVTDSDDPNYSGIVFVKSFFGIKKFYFNK
jgi:hypothetical protein